MILKYKKNPMKEEVESMKVNLHKNIFMGFFRAGMLGYGGGPSSIPLVHKEVVERYKWMSNEEFSDVLALGNTLPGPIATKMAGYIGYRVAGTLGLLNAIIATVLPTVVLMIGLIGFLSSYRDSSIVQGMTKAVSPVVGVMLFSLAYSFFKQSKAGLGWTATLILGALSFIAYQYIHPAFVIAALLLYALFRKDQANAEEPKADKKKANVADK
jgi:chromate transporter